MRRDQSRSAHHRCACRLPGKSPATLEPVKAPRKSPAEQCAAIKSNQLTIAAPANSPEPYLAPPRDRQSPQKSPAKQRAAIKADRLTIASPANSQGKPITRRSKSVKAPPKSPGRAMHRDQSQSAHHRCACNPPRKPITRRPEIPEIPAPLRHNRSGAAFSGLLRMAAYPLSITTQGGN